MTRIRGNLDYFILKLASVNSLAEHMGERLLPHSCDVRYRDQT
jgi:hypothetical protein